MPQPLFSQQLVFQGEVIEIVERGGKKMMKVNLLPCTIDLPLSMPDEPHLGDPLHVDATVMITGVEPVIFID